MQRIFLQLEEVWLSQSGAVKISARGCDSGTGDLQLEMEAFVGRDSKLNSALCSQGSRKCQITLYDAHGKVWSGSIVWSDNEWLIHRQAGDDDPAWRLDVQSVRPGGHLKIHQPGRMLSFRIVSAQKDPEPQRAANTPARIR